MTAKPDPIIPEERHSRPFLAFGLAFMTLFALGATAGATTAILQQQDRSPVLWLVVAGFAALTALSAYGLFRSIVFTRPTMNTRTGRANSMLLLAVLVGIGLSFALPPDDLGSIFSAPDAGDVLGTLPTWRMTIGLIVIVLLIPLLSLVWYRNIDEHEERAVNLGSTIGIYTYVTLTAAWWVAWRGGIAPAPDGYIIFWLTMLAWSLSWMKGKFS